MRKLKNKDNKAEKETVYFVVEISDSEIIGITKCKGLDAATGIADEKLKEELCKLGYHDPFDEKNIPNEHFAKCDAKSGYNAWIRSYSLVWDAYVYTEEAFEAFFHDGAKEG